LPRRIIAVLPSLAGGGAERVTLTLLAGLDRQRFEVHLVLLDRSGPLESMVPFDLPVTTLRQPRLWRALPDLLSQLRRLHPDVTFSTLGYVNLALAAMRNAFPGRLVIREANLPSLSLPRSGHPRLMTAGYRLLYRRADRVLATSQRMANELAAFGVASSRLAILPNPVNVATLRRRAGHVQRQPGEGLRLVVAGRLTEQKGFDRLIPLLAGQTGLHLTILGDGAQRALLEDLARRYGVALDLPGFTADAPARFAGADAVLLPSRWEGMPNVALEALACGTPVIATPESGGIAEIAAVAPPSAVTVAPMGEPFRAAILALQPRGERALRESLLPANYDAGAVAEQFANCLESLD
jgi:glycosyltransferase involved in cell wall biosynthesis